MKTMRTLCLLFALTTEIASGESFEETWKDQEILVSCQENSFIKFGCSIKSGEIFPDTCFQIEGLTECIELTLTLDYDFPCESGQLVFPSIKSHDLQDELFIYRGKSIDVSGIGPFYIYDRNENRTKEASLFKTCSLKIQKISTILSERSMKKFEEYMESREIYSNIGAQLQTVANQVKSLTTIIEKLDSQAIYKTLTTLKAKATALIDQNSLGANNSDLESAMTSIIAEIELIETVSPPSTTEKLREQCLDILANLKLKISTIEPKFNEQIVKIDGILKEYQKY